MVAVPGELFTLLGQRIKNEAETTHTFVATYANGNVGYIPAREEYSYGGYETEAAHFYYGYPAALAPSAGEMIVQTALELIESTGH